MCVFVCVRCGAGVSPVLEGSRVCENASIGVQMKPGRFEKLSLRRTLVPRC